MVNKAKYVFAKNKRKLRIMMVNNTKHKRAATTKRGEEPEIHINCRNIQYPQHHSKMDDDSSTPQERNARSVSREDWVSLPDGEIRDGNNEVENDKEKTASEVTQRATRLKKRQRS